MTEQQIKSELLVVEKKLEEVRGKEYSMTWQTMRRAKVSRKWDMLAKRKMHLLRLLDGLENTPS